MKIYNFLVQQDMYEYETMWHVWRTDINPSESRIAHGIDRLKLCLQNHTASQIKAVVFDTDTGTGTVFLDEKCPLHKRTEINPKAAALKKGKLKDNPLINPDSLWQSLVAGNPEVEF